MSTLKIMNNAYIHGAIPGETVIEIFESDSVLYKRSEFRDLTIILHGDIKNVFSQCHLVNCDVKAKSDASIVLAGHNIMTGGTFNGRDIDELLTEQFIN